MSKFKVGDKVVLSKDSEYYEASITSPDIQLSGVGVIVDISHISQLSYVPYIVEWVISGKKCKNGYNYKDLILAEDDVEDNSEFSPQSSQTASTIEDEQSFMTLLQATQKLSDGITVTTEGKFEVWSVHHDHELVFDTLDNLLEYANVVENMNSFEKNFK